MNELLSTISTLGIGGWLGQVILLAISTMGGYWASAYRNKDKKFKDVLENIQTIIALQDKKIEELYTKNNELEAKIKNKDSEISTFMRIIRNAFKCKTPSENCPVLQAQIKCDEINENK